jgi:hypothetical protein
MMELLQQANREFYPSVPAKKEGGSMSEVRSTPDAIMENLVGLHQILPSQYFDVSGGHRLTAEQRLMLALLADAINVFQQGATSRATRKRLLYIDAERWIMMAAKTAPHAFSFDTVCEALGINAGVLRRRLILWKHNVCREVETRATPHLRLKITPRARHLSHRRGHQRMVPRPTATEQSSQ